MPMTLRQQPIDDVSIIFLRNSARPRWAPWVGPPGEEIGHFPHRIRLDDSVSIGSSSDSMEVNRSRW